MTLGHARDVWIKYLCIKTKKVSGLLKKRERKEELKRDYRVITIIIMA